MSDRLPKSERPKERDNELRAKVDKVAQRLGFDSILLADGFDGALVGVGTRFIHPVAIYNYDTCVKMLANDYLDDAEATMREGYADEDALLDAEEYMIHNTTGAHVGENTPIYLRLTTDVLDAVLEEYE